MMNAKEAYADSLYAKLVDAGERQRLAEALRQLAALTESGPGANADDHQRLNWTNVYGERCGHVLRTLERSTTDALNFVFTAMRGLDEKRGELIAFLQRDLSGRRFSDVTDFQKLSTDQLWLLELVESKHIAEALESARVVYQAQTTLMLDAQKLAAVLETKVAALTEELASARKETERVRAEGPRTFKRIRMSSSNQQPV
jgi:hypothetical protein